LRVEVYPLASRLPHLGHYLEGLVAFFRCLLTLTEKYQVVLLADVFEAYFRFVSRFGNLEGPHHVKRGRIFGGIHMMEWNPK
jgi:hypothetical protein